LYSQLQHHHRRFVAVAEQSGNRPPIEGRLARMAAFLFRQMSRFEPRGLVNNFSGLALARIE
jgi:hypothetical protein